MAKALEDYPWRVYKDRNGELRPTGKLKVGKLGLVTFEQAAAHQEAGEPLHAWGFERQSGGPGAPGSARSVITTFKCRICHALRTEDRKGNVIRR